MAPQPIPEQAPAGAPRASGASRLALIATFVVLGSAVVVFAMRAASAIGSPYSKDYGEGCVMAMTQLLALHGSYFPPMTGYPYVHGNYPPVFIALNAVGYRLLGPGLAWPRALSVLATVALVALAYVLLRRRTGQTALSACFALMLLAPWFVQSWAALARVDMLACALGTLGLLLFEGAGTRAGWRRHACWPVFVLAALTKQNALLAPAAALATLALDRGRRRELPGALGVFLGTLGAAVLALQLWSGGLALRHLVTYTAAADFEWLRMLRSYRVLLVITAPLLALVAGVLVQGPRRPGRTLLVAYWVLNVLALVTIAKEGAGQNYFIEPFLATVLLAGAVAGEPGGERAWPGFALVGALVAVLVDVEDGRLPRPLRGAERAVEYRELAEAVREAPGPVLSENLAVLVTSRRPVEVEPFGFLLLTRKGLLDPAPLAEDCRAQRFALVVSEHRLEEIPGLAECLASRYEPWKLLGPYQVHRPRPRR